MSVKKASPFAHIVHICASIGVEEVDIKLMFRVGSKKAGSVRPLKILLNNKRHRKEILDHARFIKSKAPPTLQRCVITKDLTLRQREESKKKRQHKAKNTTNINNANPMNPMVYDYDEETILVSQENDSLPSQLLLRDYDRNSTSMQGKTRQHLDITQSSNSNEDDANETVCGFLADSSMVVPIGIRVERGED